MMDSLKLLNLKQKELARIMQISPAQITRIKQGKANMTIVQYGKLILELKPPQEIADAILRESMSQPEQQRIRKKKSGN